MELMKVVTDLIKIKSITGNINETNQCIEYCTELFKNTEAKIKVLRKDNIAPVFMVSNVEADDFDVLVLGHMDVVPAPDSMFEPRIENGYMYGRGTLDMKSFAAVALHSMMHVLKNKLNLKFGVILSTDEEKGSKGTHAFMEAHPNLKSTIVLDNDVGGDIYKIINACKNPVFVKILSKGLAAHGSMPWFGVDANEKLMQVWSNIRKMYPYFSKDTNGEPKDTWIDTVHFAKMGGGEVANVICDYSEALLDFRLTETSTVDNLKANLDKCMVEGVNYEIVSTSVPVVMDKNNKYIQEYKKFAEEILNHPIEFEQIGGATDSRSFAVRGSIVIMHSGNGDGMHTLNEYVEIDSVKKIADIQIKFLEKLAQEK